MAITRPKAARSLLEVCHNGAGFSSIVNPAQRYHLHWLAQTTPVEWRPLGISVRCFRSGRHRDDLSVRYEVSPPTNWGIRIVPEKIAYVIERFGKYVKTLDAVSISIDGVLYVKIVDPFKASYGVENPIYAVIQLAQTTMRSELGKITLDKTFEERDTLNENIVRSINEAARDWGLKCLRYEIRDISPPPGVRAAMEMQAEAERRKRAQVLESEGERQANINIADGKKSSVILESEAAMMDQVNRARGEAEAILARAEATAKGIAMLSDSIKASGGIEGTTMLLPSNAANPASMMAQALSIYKSLISNKVPSEREGAPPQIQQKSRFERDGSAKQNAEEDFDSFASDSASMDDLRGKSSPNLLPPVGGFSLQSPHREGLD